MTAQRLAPAAAHCTVPERCPFLDPAEATCRAALLNFLPDSRQLYHYCCTDDHDHCGVFLAKALRSSSPGGRLRDVTAYADK